MAPLTWVILSVSLILIAGVLSANSLNLWDKADTSSKDSN